MTTQKIELSAQKEKGEDSNIREHTLQKLQNLVDKDVERNTQSDRIVDREDNKSPLYDTEGFRIPVGKVPLDGQFTVSEVEELISLGQEEGDLKDNIKVKVAHKTSAFSQLTVFEGEEEDGGEGEEGQEAK